MEFINKVVFITGAASGIGFAIAEKFAAQGASLFVCDINAAGLAEAVQALASYQVDVQSQAFDVGDAEACSEAILGCVECFGRLDVLCNVAGYAKSENFTSLTISDWQKMLSVNLSSVFYLSHAAMPHLIESKGNIVNVASTAGLEGQAYNSIYSATKGGVISLSKSLAMEFAAKGVRVNVLCPGAVNTPLTSQFSIPEGADMALFSRMFPLLDMAEASEIAEAAAFVASDKARYMTGVALPLDGGSSAG
ncbi:meso-butanediol dehydrogenase/(S,S)-butanediol dehydrogenase/diacetyl reductase [Sinobacterium caligoides]|uniref:Meso-butanediol dehydrogenase/(S,S)-butanediol dehydrogenase/diacetyl reductase n=1 Tax=Sinobacterium caligoides TaxID=933926 RepID=A0A3N2DY83_9GAMM|nr:SDR family NAD(P)-dependent oxidoreductase [Sinobacterium caligoides]ROS04632.1 meso-butanediol dehydrogenase/(S,S)-butanediol dehydrogenase/diacetyl reductase [Sinobacterium caligoides]